MAATIDWPSVVAAILGSGILIAIVGWINGRTKRADVITAMASNAITAVKDAGEANKNVAILELKFAASEKEKGELAVKVSALTEANGALERKMSETANSCKAQIDGLTEQSGRQDKLIADQSALIDKMQLQFDTLNADLMAARSENTDLKAQLAAATKGTP